MTKPRGSGSTAAWNPGKRDELCIVVRTGDVIATYTSLDIGRTSNFPTTPISERTERLRAAQNGRVR